MLGPHAPFIGLYADLVFRWVVTEEITFFRAIRSIPEIMRSKLPAEYVGALDLKVSVTLPFGV